MQPVGALVEFVYHYAACERGEISIRGKERYFSHFLLTKNAKHLTTPSSGVRTSYRLSAISINETGKTSCFRLLLP